MGFPDPDLVLEELRGEGWDRTSYIKCGAHCKMKIFPLVKKIKNFKRAIAEHYKPSMGPYSIGHMPTKLALG